MIDRKTTLFCDMDGVLASFFSGAQRIYDRIERDGIPSSWLAQSRSISPSLEWIHANLGADFRITARSDLDIPAVRKLILSAIAFDPGTFFEDLPPLQDGLEALWPFLQRTDHTVVLLSAPIGARRGAGVMTAAEGKRRWAAKWLDPVPEVIICPSRDKHRYARADGCTNILIDDRLRNISQWRSAGGIGIHHIPGGSAATVSQLQRMLRLPQ